MSPRPDDAPDDAPDDQSGDPPPGGAEADGPGALTEAERRRRRAQVFGDVLPDVTGDERGEPGDRGGDPSDDWLRRQVPPHHG